MNNKNILYKTIKTQNSGKISNSSYSKIIKDFQPKFKLLNKYFKLEKLKFEETISRFKDGFIDSTEKPNFFL